jgi:hypothetical protein
MIRVKIRRIVMSVVMLSVTILNADMLSVLSFNMLNIGMLSVGMLIVMAQLSFQFLSIRQTKNLENHGQTIFSLNNLKYEDKSSTLCTIVIRSRLTKRQ